ncbi:hypothetical protein PV325_000745 [Microctonus aethiopoides]|nr:hypothetical protein PV325_000745 [Microctonus aethiopoides]
MEDKSSSNGVLKSEDVVYTLMKVSRLESPSSSSSNQSTSATNKPINCQTLNSQIDNSSTQIQNTPNKFLVNTTFNIEGKLVKILIKKLLQLHWNDYVHWKTLLSFGLGLWIALCITDKYYQREEWKLENKLHRKIIEKTINKNFEEDITSKVINNTDLKCQCTHNYFKTKSLNDEHYHNKFTIEKFKSDKKKYIYDELRPVISSKNRHSNPVEIIPYDGELHVNSDIFWELKIIDSHDKQQINYNTKRNHKHFNKLKIQSNVVANIDRASWNNNCNYNDDNRNNNDWELNSQKLFAYDWNNPFESINVNSTYDTEINKFMIFKCNKSNIAFEEITSDLIKYKNNIGRRIISNDDELSIKTIKNNKNQNNRIISSSPAFKKFLSGLRNNPTAFNTKLWISK